MTPQFTVHTMFTAVRRARCACAIKQCAQDDYDKTMLSTILINKNDEESSNFPHRPERRRVLLDGKFSSTNFVSGNRVSIARFVMV